jgi:Flp pilus assembly protein TadB
VLGIISVLNPEYLEPLVTTTLGKLMIATGLVLIALGWTTIRRIVDIQV